MWIVFKKGEIYLVDRLVANSLKKALNKIGISHCVYDNTAPVFMNLEHIQLYQTQSKTLSLLWLN